MNTFGTIKTKIEEASISLYSKPQFKIFIKEFKKMVLENKDIAELYSIYDDLSTNKGIDKDIVDDYVNESIEYSQILIESSSNKLNVLDKWISNIVKENKNNYKDIDNTIYSKSIKNLESILESKKNIKNSLIKESIKDLKESSYLPLSSMVKIANDSLKKEFSNINESEKKELNLILSLSLDEVKKEIKALQESVTLKLKSTINESKDSDLSNAINNTINKVNETKCDHYNLYKLRKLNLGL